MVNLLPPHGRAWFAYLVNESGYHRIRQSSPSGQYCASAHRFQGCDATGEFGSGFVGVDSLGQRWSVAAPSLSTGMDVLATAVAGEVDLGGA